MEGKGIFLVVLLLFSLVAISTAQICPYGSPKLFVFGDSYVDTGNWPKNVRGPWKEPFGKTFPGIPTGRASDGRVLTDHIASFLGIESPTPYQLRDTSKNIQQGLNFAYGGSGVFPSTWAKDSLSVQIDQFEQLLDENEYSQRDLDNSVALVSTGGNDYSLYSAAKKGSNDGLPAFTEGLVRQLAADLQRIAHLGVKKIVVATLPLLGCLPGHIIPPNSYQNCDEESNKNAMIHNQLLQKAVEKLKTDDGNKCTFVILDLYNAMVSAIDQFRQNAENSEYKNPLQPCCSKIVDYMCLVEGVCTNPESSFFFDLGHPSDNGWNAIFSFLKESAIRTAIRTAIARERRMAASLIRLHFHDCFVQGCDASILLDETSSVESEKTAGANRNSARGYEVIDKAKSEVEKICPGVVSCTDIIAVAARDASAYVGGPSWAVKLGRRDSTTASPALAITELPAFSDDLGRLISRFQQKGLTARDMVALSGSHTLGQAQCFTFRDRIHSDNNIDAGFASTRKRRCPLAGSNSTLAPLDLVTPNSFDNNYFKNLMQKKGLLQSDQELFSGGSTDSIVSEYSRNPAKFSSDFASAMIKMGDISPLTGSAGQIRRICSAVN